MRSLMFVALVACGGGATTTTTTTTTTTPMTAGDPSCPILVAGTSVTVEDTDTGAALVFITTGDVADVRRRAGVMAQQHNDHHAAMGPLPDGTASTAGHDHGHHAHHAQGGDHSKSHGTKGGMIAVHSKALTGEVANGAKLVFIAGATDVGKLQSELRARAQHYAAGSCEVR